MDFDKARKIAEKLENNLTILQKASEFISDTHEKQGTYASGSTSGVFESLKDALVVYIECNGDKSKLEELIQSMEEAANNLPDNDGFTVRLGHTLIDLINAPHIFSGQKHLDYNTEADRILKEIEAQTSVLCKAFSIEKPEKVSSGRTFSGFQSNIKNLEQTFNVVKAVKSLTD